MHPPNHEPSGGDHYPEPYQHRSVLRIFNSIRGINDIYPSARLLLLKEIPRCCSMPEQPIAVLYLFCKYIQIYLYIILLIGIWIVSSFLVIVKNAAVNIFTSVFGAYIYLCLLVRT